jgi:hypothetical protein
LALWPAAGLPSQPKPIFAATVILNLIFIKKYYIISIENNKGELCMHTDDIYSRLLAGESSDDIAAEMTKALNDALDRIEEEEKVRKAKEEEEARAAAEKTAYAKAKREAAAEILADMLAFCAMYYPSLGLTMSDQVSDEELYALTDLVLMVFDLEAMKPANRKTSIKFSKPRNQESDLEKNNKPLTTDDIFANAFKMLGI